MGISVGPEDPETLHCDRRHACPDNPADVRIHEPAMAGSGMCTVASTIRSEGNDNVADTDGEGTEGHWGGGRVGGGVECTDVAETQTATGHDEALGTEIDADARSEH
eukprot:2116083-Rhodomonas_salina.1